MPGPLHGFRIVDCSAVISGPLTATLLADQGASVIKVEPPGAGDVLRHVGSRRGGMSGMFHVINRGKRAITLDLRRDEGRDVLLQLVDRADVFIQNFRPGVTDRMGIGSEALCERRPELVYVSISGFGSEGPYAQKRVYDNIIQAYSGMAHVQQEAGDPRLLRQLVCDKLTALTASQAVTAALLARERGSGGQHVELSMLDAAVAFLWPDAAANHTLLGEGVDVQPTIGSSYGLVPASDGFTTGSVLSDAEFQALCVALELDEAAADPRFATVADRMKNIQAVGRLFQEEIAGRASQRTREEMDAALTAHDVPWGVVRTLDELHEDPQVVANGTLRVREHPLAGRLREPRPPARFGSTVAEPAAPAPAAGQHTDEILREAGLGDRIEELRAAGVVS